LAKPTIISCAVTGNITTIDQTPYLPVTPEQIAAACIDAARAGAAIVHIHVRHPDGRPSMELQHYREVVERLRAADEDVIINLTTGPGGRFVPSEDEPRIAAPGTTLMRPEHRVEHVASLRPEICSLDFNTMYSGSSVVINTPRNLAVMADIIRNAGVLPEIEVFDTGDIQLANQFLQEGRLAQPALFQIVLGVRYGAIARIGRPLASGAGSFRCWRRPGFWAATFGSAWRITSIWKKASLPGATPCSWTRPCAF
jgi:uncharacterized protein (DUF849 family)